MEFYYDVHDGPGPFLLMVHGFLSSRSQWAPNLEALAQVARPVVVELWGHGRSPAPDDPVLYHPDTYIKIFERLRQRLGVERWLLCGQSFGAALTWRYALDHPERIMAHVFTNSSAAFADAEWIETRRQSVIQQIAALERDGKAALESFRVHPSHARRLPPDIQAQLLADAALHSPHGIAQTLRYATLNVPVRDRLKDNRVPALLVCGGRERRFAHHRTFAQHEIPCLECVDTAAGHAVNIEAAEAFNAAVSDFITRQTSRSAGDLSPCHERQRPGARGGA
jgi:pimeloyl-ACP methyl ester carboxylesterase